MDVSNTDVRFYADDAVLYCFTPSQKETLGNLLSDLMLYDKDLQPVTPIEADINQAIVNTCLSFHSWYDKWKAELFFQG